MAMRLELTIDDAHAVVLHELAKRSHVQAGTLAESMLVAALARTMARAEDRGSAGDVDALLNSIPGALSDHREGMRQIADGHAGHTLDEV
jgi:hypothetical protein